MQQLATSIRASISGILIQTQEEDRALAAVKHTARRELKSKNVPNGYGCLTWTVTNGVDYTIDPSLTGVEQQREEMVRSKTADPILALKLFMDDKVKVPPYTIMVMLDFHLQLKAGNPTMIRLMKEAIRHGRKTNRHIIIIGPEAVKHPELEKEILVMDMPLPNRDDLLEIIHVMMQASGLKEDNESAYEPLVIALSGLTASEAMDALSVSLVKKKKFDPDVIKQIKTNTIKKNSVVEVVEDRVDVGKVGGLDAVKTWIKKRIEAFGIKAKDYGVASPKGVLVIGISGTGKSLIGKVVSSVLGRPMLRLDGGKIFGSLMGESEKNMRAAMAVAEAMAPCVLFIDELEKAMGGSESSGKCDGGTTSRVLGTFLQWLQDKTAQVFVVATANDVSKLPPELLRRGRFDQVFFVDIPSFEERVQIWDIHIRSTNRKSDSFDIGQLAKKTEGFTGAEIESIVADGILDAFTDGVEPTTETFINAIGNTVPLSSTMKEKIASMRKWAEGRAINASGRKHETKKETKETETVTRDERPVLDLSV